MYTEFGEEWKTSRPYRSGDTIQWTENFYDSQRRLHKVVGPDGSVSEAFFNETSVPDSTTSMPGNTVRSVDPWGRERWGRYDQQGRLTHVVEPNPDKTANPNGKIFSGGNPVSGSLLTIYKYDTLGRLIETEQGTQVRKFKYDDLGRLTRQKLAEQTATLNEAGEFVGIGHQNAVWAEAFAYDSRSNLRRRRMPAASHKFSYSLAVAAGPAESDTVSNLRHFGPVTAESDDPQYVGNVRHL